MPWEESDRPSLEFCKNLSKIAGMAALIYPGKTAMLSLPIIG